MDYKILYKDAFPIIEADLVSGETIKAESDAMVSMTNTIDLAGKLEGGVLAGFGRMLSGEKFFFQTLKAARGNGRVMLAPAIPGSIVDVGLDGSYGLAVQKDGFLAATESVNIETKMQNIAKGFLSKEGFFILRINGKGTVFINSYGAIHKIELADKEEIIVDNGHLVAWTEYTSYKIEKAAKGWISSITSGEGLVCRFTGPGTIYIQTRNPNGFKEWIQSKLGSR
ncbi:MAG: TIGR00266 family protein [Clostridiales bacterium]